MKKIMILVIAGMLSMLSMTGCGGKEMQSFAYEAKEIKGIVIETEDNSVQIVQGSGDKIQVSYTEEVAKIEDGILFINIPTPGGGINFKESIAVVSLPDITLEVIQVKSEAGNVLIDHINANELTVTAQYGSITLSGAAGKITAKSEMDSIKTELPIASDIVGAGEAGQTVTGQIGDSDATVNLYTNTGRIELK